MRHAARASASAGRLIVLALLWPAAPARALDVELESDTLFRVYDVRSPATLDVWSRRRMVEQVDLQLVQPYGSADRFGRVARVHGVVSLRLENDFGSLCTVNHERCFEPTDSRNLGSFEPIARDGRVDLPLAYLELDGLPHALRVRAGRQMHWDVVGFARIDGLGARVEPASWLAFEAVAGMLVRSSSIAGTDAFVPQGVPRVELDATLPLAAPHVAPPAPTALAGGSVELGDLRVVRTTLVYRRLLDDEGTSQHSAGFGLGSRPVEPLGVDAHAVLDLLALEIVEAQLAARVFMGDATPRVVLRRQVPRFDAGTIWAYFNPVPVWEGTLGVLLQPLASLDLDVALNGRRAQLDDARQDDDFGGKASLGVHLPRTELGVSGFGWSGGLGTVWGTDLFASRHVLRWLLLDARFSVHRLDDPLRAPMQGISVFESFGARVPLGELSEFAAELSHAHSAPVGNRFQFFASLTLGGWR